jgi:hypothetical protein
MAKFPTRPKGVHINGARSRGWGSGWPNCQRSRMTTIKLKSGLRLEVRREIGELVRLLLDECERRGYRLKHKSSGSFNCRPIVDSDPPRPSNHSWGLAVDLNWHDNPMQDRLKTNIPPWMVQLMWAYGFFWGGWYNGTKDPMHFEFVKTPAQAAALTTSLKRAIGAQFGKPATARTIPFGDDMFNPYFVRTAGDPRVFIVTSGGVFHVKNPTHMKYLIDGGVQKDVKEISRGDLKDLLEIE